MVYERAQRELICEKRYDQSKAKATYAKVHDLKIKNYKSLLSMKHEMEIKQIQQQPTPQPNSRRLNATQFMSQIQQQKQYYQQLAGGDEKQSNQYPNNPTTAQQLAQTINENFGDPLLPPRDHFGIMPSETTGQVQIPAPPHTTVQNRYTTQPPNITQNLTQQQAQVFNQNLANLGVHVPTPPNLLSNLPAQANTS